MTATLTVGGRSRREAAKAHGNSRLFCTHPKTDGPARLCRSPGLFGGGMIDPQYKGTLAAPQRFGVSALVGFGVGWSWGGVVVDLSRTVVLPPRVV